jgi:hypothetical protein
VLTACARIEADETSKPAAQQLINALFIVSSFH